MFHRIKYNFIPGSRVSVPAAVRLPGSADAEEPTPVSVRSSVLPRAHPRARVLAGRPSPDEGAGIQPGEVLGAVALAAPRAGPVLLGRPRSADGPRRRQLDRRGAQ